MSEVVLPVVRENMRALRGVSRILVAAGLLLLAAGGALLEILLRRSRE